MQAVGDKCEGLGLGAEVGYKGGRAGSVLGTSSGAASAQGGNQPGHVEADGAPGSAWRNLGSLSSQGHCAAAVTPAEGLRGREKGQWGLFVLCSRPLAFHG